MKESILVTGGCRSGKSAYALMAAERAAARNRYFVATCVPGDDEEMRDRVARHRLERGDNWQTVECPVDVAGVIDSIQEREAVVLVDCLTLWMNNLLAATEDQDEIETHIINLRKAISRTTGTIILVTNEVGCGIVPENRLARLFRDMVGLTNQRLADEVDRVVWMVSGIPVTIKSGADR